MKQPNMYRYAFVRIELSWLNNPKKNYREIIKKYAARGWRFKQIFAPGTAGSGRAEYFEINFEREVLPTED
jgi:hypothetical protein